MDGQVKMAKQLMDLQRATCEGMLNNMIVFWDQTEKFLGALVDSAMWVPPESKSAFKEWIVCNNKSCRTFKRTVTEGFSWMETFLNAHTKPRKSDDGT
jgi:hypothetical protein